MKPLTIAHLITELDVGGAEQMLFKLVTHMDREKFRSVVLSMTDIGPIGEKIKTGGIPVFALGMAPGKPTLKGCGKLFRFLREESVSILQTWLYHADLLGLIVGRIAEVKRVVWGIRCSNMHLRAYRPLTDLTFRINALMSPLVDAIVVNSAEGREVHRIRGYQTDRMVVIPNGFDTELFQPDESRRDWLLQQLGVRDEVALIGLVARFDPMKDQRTFLKAAAILAEKEKSTQFVMVGRGIDAENPELIELMENGGLRKRVHLFGLRHDTHRIIAGLDIATSSSAFGEGFSNTVGEAMSCGVPCVVTDVGDSAHVVGDTGIVVPKGDPEAMANAWAELLRIGRVGRKQLGEKARLRIVENFEIGNVVSQFENLYEKLGKHV